MKKEEFLTNHYFLLGLTILILNDLYFKYTFGGFITGKLSDISGLFIFPFFWSIFFRNHKLNIYILTAIAFTIWKLPISSAVISSLNDLLGVNFYRTIDYTDIFTLIILPVSYRYFSHLQSKDINSTKSSFTSISICVISVIAFVATSLPFYVIKSTLSIEHSYTLDISKEKLLTEKLTPDPTSDKLSVNMNDTLFVVKFRKGTERIFTKVKIHELNKTQVNLELVSIEACVLTGSFFRGVSKNLIHKIEDRTKDDYLSIFKKEVVDVIQSNKHIQGSIMYSNPKLDSTALINFY